MEQLNEVVKFILYKSRESNHPLTEVMAYYLAQLREVKELALKKIQARDQPAMKTLLMQVAFNTSQFEIESRREEDSRARAEESGKLIDEVINLEVKSSKDFEGLTELYNKVFNYLLYKARELTNPAEMVDQAHSVNKEVAAALESIIPRAALNPFATLNPTEKLNQLIELSNLVLGIRLFNQEIQKGGPTLIPVRELLDHPGRDLLRLVRKEASEVIELCENYSIVFMLDIADITTVASEAEMTRFKDELTFLRQYLSYIVSLQEDIEITENAIDINETRFRKEVQDLKNLLGTKTSAPQGAGLPQVRSSGQLLHPPLRGRRRWPAPASTCSTSSHEARKELAITLTKKVVHLAKSTLATAESVNSVSVEFNYALTGVDRLMPHESPDFMQTPLDFLGFCVWSIVKKKGLLLPGKPTLGVYRYKDKSCVFSTEKCINEFLKGPDEYLEGVAEQCRQHPELIYLLRMEDYFRGVDLNIVNYLQEGARVKSSMMVDKSTQTPLHFLEKNLDPSYCWNEWEAAEEGHPDGQHPPFLLKDTASNTMKHHGFSAERFPIEVYPPEDARERPRVYIAGIRDKTRS
ncbi:cilia- and flagella-associated protein 206-like [Hippocampus zosterae]|uniref:cilia- and flagella-associated protein 206-like n=1 Tax=Hippocampus zosterae TaxID=109293 RepID=UPI00223D4C81|nr:cilia- and flagella-associated protein 206-like [Hippocampus zosterae]